MTKVGELLIQIHEMSRGIVVLDADLRGIENELRNKNLVVIVPPQELKDDAIIQGYLSGRIFVTNNSKDFVHSAIESEFSIIATESTKSKDPKELSKIISRSIIDFQLWSKPPGWILRLKENGKHEFEVLPK